MHHRGYIPYTFFNFLLVYLYWCDVAVNISVRFYNAIVPHSFGLLSLVLLPLLFCYFCSLVIVMISVFVQNRIEFNLSLALKAFLLIIATDSVISVTFFPTDSISIQVDAFCMRFQPRFPKQIGNDQSETTDTTFVLFSHACTPSRKATNEMYW